MIRAERHSVQPIHYLLDLSLRGFLTEIPFELFCAKKDGKIEISKTDGTVNSLVNVIIAPLAEVGVAERQ